MILQGEDYIIDYDNYGIIMLKTGKYNNKHNQSSSSTYYGTSSINESELIKIAYGYTETSSISSEYYETYIYVDFDTEVIVQPFSVPEISAGNFHKINGDNISSIGFYILTTGWNLIQTTQPYKSLYENDNDVNILTNKPSDAGIIIPDTVSIMRPFKDSMRQVSPFVLSTMEEKEAKKCFAFSNGKLLISFKPNFVDPYFLIDNEKVNETGEDLICKKPVLDSVTFINTAYISFPEQFNFTITYTDISKERVLTLRAEIEAEDILSSASISRIGINKFREEL